MDLIYLLAAFGQSYWFFIVIFYLIVGWICPTMFKEMTLSYTYIGAVLQTHLILLICGAILLMLFGIAEYRVAKDDYKI